jgi:hypothetical protein
MLGPLTNFIGSEFAGCRRGTGHQIGDADAHARQRRLFTGQKDSIGETTGVKEFPESIARAGEVLAEFGRFQSRIDAAEQHEQIRSSEVGEGVAVHLEAPGYTDAEGRRAQTGDESTEGVHECLGSVAVADEVDTFPTGGGPGGVATAESDAGHG